MMDQNVWHHVEKKDYMKENIGATLQILGTFANLNLKVSFFYSSIMYIKNLFNPYKDDLFIPSIERRLFWISF